MLTHLVSPKSNLGRRPPHQTIFYLSSLPLLRGGSHLVYYFLPNVYNLISPQPSMANTRKPNAKVSNQVQCMTTHFK